MQAAWQAWAFCSNLAVEVLIMILAGCSCQLSPQALLGAGLGPDHLLAGMQQLLDLSHMIMPDVNLLLRITGRDASNRHRVDTSADADAGCMLAMHAACPCPDVCAFLIATPFLSSACLCSRALPLQHLILDHFAHVQAMC